MRISIRLFLILSVVVATLTSCIGAGRSGYFPDIIYRCDKFIVAADRLLKGDTTIKAISPSYLLCEKDTSLTWEARNIPEGYPSYESDQPLIDALYNRAVVEIDSGGTSLSQHTGWTTWMAMCYINPRAALDSLKAHVGNDEIVSHPGAFQWPVSSDRSAWILAAGELQRVTGDKDLLKQIERIASNTIGRDTLACRDSRNGLIYGSQTYLLPQPALYPEWMNMTDIYQSPCLGTNLSIAAAAKETARIYRQLNNGSAERFTQLSQSICTAVEKSLWQPNLGYFSSYLYCYPYSVQLQATDNMAQAIGVIFDMFDPQVSANIIKKSPVFEAGVPTMYPMPQAYRERCDEAVRPLTQAMWTLAAMKMRNEKAFNLSFGSLVEMNLTNYRSKYYSAGIVAAVFRGFAGMNFEENGIRFTPYVPEVMGGYKRIKNFKYRDALLDIYISGSGDSITEFNIDGQQSRSFLFPDTLKGKHFVSIELSRRHNGYQSGVNICQPTYMPATPNVKWSGSRNALITNYQPEIDYQLLINGEFQTIIASSHYRMFSTNSYTVVNFIPTFSNMWTGFSQQPYRYTPGDTRNVIDIKNNVLDLHEITPGSYMITLTYESADSTAIGEITSADRCQSEPVLFLPSGKKSARSSAVTITVERHRIFKIEPRDGKLPHVSKAVLIRLD